METDKKALKLLLSALIVGILAIMKHFGYVPVIPLESSTSGKATNVQIIGDDNTNPVQIIGDDN